MVLCNNTVVYSYDYDYWSNHRNGESMSPCRIRQPSKSYVLFKERLGQDDPLKDSIDMLCLPLGMATLEKVSGQIRVNGWEWWYNYIRDMSQNCSLKCQPGLEKQDETRWRVNLLYATPVWSSSSGTINRLVRFAKLTIVWCGGCRIFRWRRGNSPGHIVLLFGR